LYAATIQEKQQYPATGTLFFHTPIYNKKAIKKKKKKKEGKE
jgi:hypothetical protein